MDKRYQQIRSFYKTYLNNIVQILVKEGINPNLFSYTVLFLCFIFAFFMLAEGVRQAGAVALIIAVCDIMGSLVADDMGEKNKISGLLDSILDKYSEIIFYTAIIVTGLQIENTILALFAFLALIGASMTTFIINKAKQFDINIDWGFIRRPERILLLAFGMFFGFTGLTIASVIVALVANATALYFVWHICFSKKK